MKRRAFSRIDAKPAGNAAAPRTRSAEPLRKPATMKGRWKVLILLTVLAGVVDSAPAQQDHPEIAEPVRLAPKLWNTDGTILCYPKCNPAGPCC